MKSVNKIKNYLFGYYDAEQESSRLKDLFAPGEELNKYYKDLLSITENFEISELLSKCLFELNSMDVKSINKLYLKKINEINFMSLESQIWNELRFIFEKRGLLLISHIFRKKCKERILSTMSIACSFGRYLCNFENGNYEECKELLNKWYFKIFKHTSIYKDFKKLYLLVNNKVKYNDEFGDYCKNKKVILVGPCSNGDTYDVTADDIIANFTYTGSINNDKIDRINISYYNGENTSRIIDKNPDFINKLDFCCTKETSKLKSRKIRTINTFKYVMPFGGANMAQLFILDLLHYKCKEIMIYDINVSITKNMYNSSYARKTEPNSVRTSTYAMHDIEGNFLLLKHLYYSGLFECDKTLEEILSLTGYEYIEQLENNIYE